MHKVSASGLSRTRRLRSSSRLQARPSKSLQLPVYRSLPCITPAIPGVEAGERISHVPDMLPVPL